MWANRTSFERQQQVVVVDDGGAVKCFDSKLKLVWESHLHGDRARNIEHHTRYYPGFSSRSRSLNPQRGCGDCVSNSIARRRPWICDCGTPLPHTCKAVRTHITDKLTLITSSLGNPRSMSPEAEFKRLSKRYIRRPLLLSSADQPTSCIFRLPPPTDCP